MSGIWLNVFLFVAIEKVANTEDIRVAYADPTMPNKGIKIIFNITFTIIPIKVL